MNATVTVLVVYLGILAALAAWSRRETHTLSGFHLAGKKLPYWIVVGEVIGIGLSWMLISRRLKRLGDETDSITVPDVLAAKFADRWHLIRGAAVLIILVMVTTYVTAQMASSGKAFSSFLGLIAVPLAAISAVLPQASSGSPGSSNSITACTRRFRASWRASCRRGWSAG